MSRLFLSHSSKNDAEALALRDWLDANGWSREDVFLDLDPSRGLAPGEQWQLKLKEASHRCEAVIFVISPAWTQSRWCGAEFLLAKTLGKKIFGVIVEQTPLEALPPELTNEFQLVDLTVSGEHAASAALNEPGDTKARVAFSDQGLQRLRTGLQKAGLDANSFVFDPERPIFRGLKALEEEDAAIFFGREAKIIEALDALRALSDKGSSKFFVVLGASGAGKSSFLRAGLWPRLARDDRSFLPLPIVRPTQAVISGESGLVTSLSAAAKALSVDLTRAWIEETLESPHGLRQILTKLQMAARRRLINDSAKPPLVVLSIDQGEELLGPDPNREVTKFFDIVCPLVRDGPLLVLACIRSDGFERLQGALQARDLAVDLTLFSLPPMPAGAYKEVIDGPVRRLQGTKGENAITLDPRLTEQVLTDIGGSGADALPLLAFTIERLYRKFNALTLVDYRGSSGLQGAIIEAVAEALKNPDRPPAIPEKVETQRVLLRKALIPHLARIDPNTREPSRRIAKLSDLDPETHAVIDRLVEARILTKDRPWSKGDDPASDQCTRVELVHEALLRLWPELVAWLKDEHANLIQLEQLHQAAEEWDHNSRMPEWLVHKGGRLADAEALSRREDFKKALGSGAIEYLKACGEFEMAALDKDKRAIQRDKEQLATIAAANRRDARRLLAGVGLLAMFAVVLGLGAVQLWGLSQAVSERETRLILRDAMSISAPDGDPTKGDALSGLQMALLAVPQHVDSLTGPSRVLVRDALRASLARVNIEQLHVFPDIVTSLAPLCTDDRLVATSGDAAHEMSLSTGAISQLRMNHGARIWSADVDQDARIVITGADDGTARVWNSQTSASIAVLPRQTGSVRVAISRDGTKFATGDHDGSVLVWIGRGQDISQFHHPGYEVRDMEFSPDGALLAVATTDKVAHIYELASGRRKVTLTGHTDTLRSISFSRDGSRVVTGSSDRSARIWQVVTGEPIVTLLGHEDAVRSGAFSRDGMWVATGSWDKTAKIWNARSGRLVMNFAGHEGPVRAVMFARNDRVLITGSNDKTIRVWDTSFALPEIRLPGHSRSVTSVRVAGNGSVIATASDDGSVRIWQKSSGDLLGIIELGGPEANALDLTPDGNTIVVGSRDGLARLWNWRSGKMIRAFKGHAQSVLAVDISADGTKLATASRDGTVRIWDLVNGVSLRVLRGHRGAVMSVQFSPDGRTVLSAGTDTYAFGKDTYALLWDASTGKQLRGFSGHSDAVRGAIFLSNGSKVATASGDSTAAIWETATGRPLHVLTGHHGGVNALDVSQDGNWLITGSDDRTARVWDITSGLTVATLGEQSEGINAVAFSPDVRNEIVIGVGDGTASIWNPELRVLSHDAETLASEACRTLVTIGAASLDLDSRVKTAANGKPLSCAQSHN